MAMIKKIRVCNIARVWDGAYCFGIYTDDDNVLKAATAIEIYI